MPQIPIYRSKLEQMGTLEVTHEFVRTTEAAAEVVLPYIKDADREYLVALYLEANGQVIGLEVIAIGSTTQATTSIKELMKGALNIGALAVVLAHNHPNSDVSASKEDIDLTRDFQKVATYHGIQLIESIIINTKGEFNSIMQALNPPEAVKGKEAFNEIFKRAKENNIPEKIGFFTKLLLRLGIGLFASYFIGFLIHTGIHNFDRIKNMEPLTLGLIAFCTYFACMMLHDAFTVPRPLWPKVKVAEVTHSKEINKQ